MVALTPEIIEEYNLPSRRTKRSDSRAANWDGESYELDALSPQQLQDTVRGAILRHLDRERYKGTQQKQAKAQKVPLKLLEGA